MASWCICRWNNARSRKELQSYFNERYGKYHSPGVLAKDKDIED